MIDKDDLRYIHSDLSELINKMVEKEEYEKCKLAKDYMIRIENYLAGIIQDDDLINSLFDLCFSRYAILRLIVVDGYRYVVFLIPNSSVIFFDVEPETIPESETWQRLKNEYIRVTLEITKNILKTA